MKSVDNYNSHNGATEMSLNGRLMAAVILVLHGLALPVAAEIVFNDNSARIFEWLPDSRTEEPFNYFDPTLPPTQTGEQTPTSLGFTQADPVSSFHLDVGSFHGSGGIELAVGDTFLAQGVGGSVSVTPVQRFRPWESVGPHADWSPTAEHTWAGGEFGTQLLLRDHGLIGFRTGADGQYNYGWIELGLRMFEAPYHGLHYQPIRWAYETELNTPITVIPEPASICSLLLCILFATSLLFVRRAVFP
jgi:hypothetical protein